MAKTRVYELARDLNMTNKVLLDKIKEMDLDVKAQMSSLEDDMVSRIKSNLLGTKDKSVVEEKRVKPAVIRRRKKQTPEQPELKEAVPETEAEEVEPAEAEAEETAPKKAAKAKKAPAKKKAAPKKTAPKKAVKDDAEKGAKVIAIPEKEAEKEPEPEAEKPAEEPEEAAEPAKAKKAPAKKKAAAKKTAKQAAAKIINPPKPEETAESAGSKKGPARAKKRKALEGKAAPSSAVKPDEISDKDAKKKRRKKKQAEPDEDNKFFKKKISFRKKAIVEGKALYDDTVRVRGRKGRKGGKAKQAVGQKTQITTPKAIKRRIKIDDTIILSDLSKRMGVKANEMIQKLMAMGVMATVNQTIDFDTAVLVAAEFDYELEKASFEEEIILSIQEDDPTKLSGRPPVVTIMGHVDHGKTSLLDVIRKSSITDLEAGGITQHIGAYHVNTDKGQIVFLDTPGHEAFTAMRSRGAKVTDIVILVVAADDGVMPQTIEAINHSKAAEVPIIVAINKIDKPDAEPDRVMRELSEEGIVSEEWGGDVIFVNVSAKQNKGIDDLLDMILLQAEVQEFKANPDKLARGHVIEAKLDSGRGPAATILIQEGTLHAGQSVVCGIHYGKIRAMLDDKGKPVDKAGPSIPVEILGLTGVPVAGDEMITIDDEKNAKQVSSHRMQKQRAKELARSSRMSLEGLFERMEEGELKELNVILKADVQGSIEALKDSFAKLATNEVKINVVHSATGTITESDVSLATVSNAIIIGFNVRPGAKVHEMAAEENVDMRFYDIIYNAIKDLKGAMIGIMDSKFEERIIGRAEVRETFVIPKKGTIAGSYVTDGKIERGQLIRLLRDGVIVHDGKIGSLRRFKDDAREVMAGYECGIGIENYNDIKMKDTIECYYLEEIKPTLE